MQRDRLDHSDAVGPRLARIQSRPDERMGQKPHNRCQLGWLYLNGSDRSLARILSAPVSRGAAWCRGDAPLVVGSRLRRRDAPYRANPAGSCRSNAFVRVLKKNHRLRGDFRGQAFAWSSNNRGFKGSPGSESGAPTPTTVAPAPPVPSTSGSSEPKAGSKVSPLPAPDSSTQAGQAGQEKGTAAGTLKSQDESKVPGMPGGKSGPSTK
jgi:hypothetical protein